MRHLILALIVLGFVAVHTERLRGGNAEVTQGQVCRALSAVCRRLFRRWRGTADLPHVGDIIRYHQRRNEQATRSHKKRPHRCVIEHCRSPGYSGWNGSPTRNGRIGA